MHPEDDVAEFLASGLLSFTVCSSIFWDCGEGSIRREVVKLSGGEIIVGGIGNWNSTTIMNDPSCFERKSSFKHESWWPFTVDANMQCSELR